MLPEGAKQAVEKTSNLRDRCRELTGVRGLDQREPGSQFALGIKFGVRTESDREVVRVGSSRVSGSLGDVEGIETQDLRIWWANPKRSRGGQCSVSV